MSRLVTLLMALGLMAHTQSMFAESCETEAGIKQMCYEMKHLRSNIYLLEWQDLGSAPDYKFFENAAKAMRSSITSLIVNRYGHEHLKMLEELSNELKQLQNEAELKNPQVAIMVSGIKESCRECHNQENFPDKKRLSKVFLTDTIASLTF